MSSKAPVDSLIDSFQPAWTPPADELKGLVVVIAPLGGGSATSADRARDDLALKTGEHLYHLIRRAGGVCVMTRADDRALPAADGGPEKAMAGICARHKADIAITIGFENGQVPGAVPNADDVVSKSLATALASGSGKPAVHPRGRPGVPGVAAWFGVPADSMPAARRKAFHRECAQELYKGLAQTVDRNRDALDLTPPKQDDDPEEADSVPNYPSRPAGRTLAAAARRLWPEGDLPVEKAAWFCRLYCRANLSDQTAVYLAPEIKVEGETVVVGGATNMAILRETLADALKAVGVRQVRNEMKLLPEDGRLDSKRFGVCVAPMALTFEAPSESGPLQTQILYGELLFLLDHDAARGYYLLHSADGYWGWVRASCVRPISEEEFKQYATATPAVLLRDVEIGEHRITRGSTLSMVRKSESNVRLMHPGGGTFELPAADVRILDGATEAEQRVLRALEFLHTPYVFGAVSSLGLDCSGLVRNVHVQAGVVLPRDAAQQFLNGRLVATRWYRDAIQPGDVLFFINRSGKIYHTGIAMNSTHFVHSAPPEVQINSLKECDRLYSEQRAESFLGAKRW